MFNSNYMNMLYGFVLLILSLRSLGYILQNEYGFLGFHIIVFLLCLPGGIYYIYRTLSTASSNQ